MGAIRVDWIQEERNAQWASAPVSKQLDAIVYIGFMTYIILSRQPAMKKSVTSIPSATTTISPLIEQGSAEETISESD